VVQVRYPALAVIAATLLAPCGAQAEMFDQTSSERAFEMTFGRLGNQQKPADTSSSRLTTDKPIGELDCSQETLARVARAPGMGADLYAWRCEERNKQ
jgi:hypothetical protein